MHGLLLAHPLHFRVWIMIDGIASYVEWKSRTKTKGPKAGVAPKAPPQLDAEPRDQQLGFTKGPRVMLLFAQTK